MNKLSMLSRLFLSIWLIVNFYLIFVRRLFIMTARASREERNPGAQFLSDVI